MPETWVQYNKELPYIEDRQPWEIPTCYLRKKGINNYEVVKGRRPSKMLLINKMRPELDNWRKNGYPGATKTSKEILTFWFEQSHSPVLDNEPFNFYFCQQEAIETIIYLYEVKEYNDIEPLIQDYHEEYKGTLFASEVEFTEDLEGNRKLKRYFPELEQLGEQELPEQDLLRYAIKMATGSGKTMVMALAIVWSYYNRIREKSKRYADNFLIIAPNVIVYERLKKDFANNKIFIEFPFIPDSWKPMWKPNIKLRGDESPLSPSTNLIVNNIHQLYESRIKEWKPETIIQAILGRKPQKDPTKSPQTLLERIKELDNLMVLNDEAHHVHDDELKWNESLLSIHNSLPNGLMMWLDFSATPKTPSGTYYPWIVTDYPLAQAVEDRIVKAPLIVHTVNKKDPEGVTKNNVVAKYGDWITAALSRWEEHNNAYKKVGKKPVLFIMAEKNQYADKLGEAIAEIGRNYGIKKDEILIIHTDSTGEIRKSDLESLREEARKTVLKMEMYQLGVEVHQTAIDTEYLELGRGLISLITKDVMKKARLTDCFSILYPVVEEYILNRCFEVKLTDIEKEELRKKLKEITIQETIVDLLSKEIGKKTVKQKKIKIQGKPIKLSETRKFTWRRKRLRCNKTIFNFVAVYNDFEAEFAEFLDKANDIESFAALADIFKIDYLTSKGAIRYYFPDFVAVQKKGKKNIYWILETKGREYPELENKNKAIERWCKSITDQTKKQWKYLLVKQIFFDARKKNVNTFEKLVTNLTEKTELLI